VPDPHDEHHQDIVQNFVNHPVVPDPDPVSVVRSDQFLATRRAWIIRKVRNFSDDPWNLFSVDPA
jgi:hypothetical protein